jgi:hypothetical protein
MTLADAIARDLPFQLELPGSAQPTRSRGYGNSGRAALRSFFPTTG